MMFTSIEKSLSSARHVASSSISCVLIFQWSNRGADEADVCGVACRRKDAYSNKWCNTRADIRSRSFVRYMICADDGNLSRLV
jgi:hypothetical protein